MRGSAICLIFMALKTNTVGHKIPYDPPSLFGGREFRGRGKSFGDRTKTIDNFLDNGIIVSLRNSALRLTSTNNLVRRIRLQRTFQVLAMTVENSLMSQGTTKIWR